MADGTQPFYFSDGIDPVFRNSPSELFLITIEARPEANSNGQPDAGGAFVNCWVDSDDLRTAERRCVALMQEGGWRPHRFDEWSLVTRDTYNDWQPNDDGGPDLREIINQTFADGEVCIIHTWPVDATDSSDNA